MKFSRAIAADTEAYVRMPSFFTEAARMLNVS
jgi:hypothetical protein